MRTSTLCTTILLTLLTVCAATTAASALDEPLASADIRLEVEPLLVDDTGIHPLLGAAEEPKTMEGAFFHTVRLGESDESYLTYKIAYRLVDRVQVGLELERTLVRNGRERTLPAQEHKMSVLEAWTATLLEETGKGGRLVLRVTPIIRQAVRDVPFDSTDLSMRFRSGPVLLFGEGYDDHRVLFVGFNTAGPRVEFGVPGIGAVRFSQEKFPGAVECGWVRGHRWQVSLDGHRFAGWSSVQILPDDPERPEAGWVLYGDIDADGMIHENSYYGGFRLEDL